METAVYVKINNNIFHKNSNYLIFVELTPYYWAHYPKIMLIA